MGFRGLEHLSGFPPLNSMCSLAARAGGFRSTFSPLTGRAGEQPGRWVSEHFGRGHAETRHDDGSGVLEQRA